MLDTDRERTPGAGRDTGPGTGHDSGPGTARCTGDDSGRGNGHSARPDEWTAVDLRARARPYESYRARTGRTRSQEYFSLKNSLLAFGLGALFCWWDSRGGIGHAVLRFIDVLTHEIGHASVATLFGAPAFPVIRLDGHAAAVHSGQVTWLAIGVWLFFGYMAWQRRTEGRRYVAFAIAAAMYPLAAFTGSWEVLFLLAGHAGSLAFAGVFFWRAWTGGFTESLKERYLYASLAWFLAVTNLVFHFRLLTDEEVRAEYYGNGSFGLPNDYARVALDTGVSLQTVALGMLLVNVVVLPAVVWWTVRGEHRGVVPVDVTPGRHRAGS